MNAPAINKLDMLLDSFAIKQTKFNSTKELYQYARKRIVGVASSLRQEYLIVANTRKNEILLEKMGDNKQVFFETWILPSNRKDITVLHGHPRNKVPLSPADCLHLCHNEYDKVIAFDKKGRFSLLQLFPNSDIKKAVVFFEHIFKTSNNPLLKKISMSKFLLNRQNFIRRCNEMWLKEYIFKEKINMRYVSNMHK